MSTRKAHGLPSVGLVPRAPPVWYHREHGQGETRAEEKDVCQLVEGEKATDRLEGETRSRAEEAVEQCDAAQGLLRRQAEGEADGETEGEEGPDACSEQRPRGQASGRETRDVQTSPA